MKTLYFYSHNDGLIRHASINSVKQVIGIVNEFYEEEFFSFLAFRVSVLKNHDFKHYINRVSSKTIRLLLDAAGYPDKYVSNGEELNNLLMRDIKELFEVSNRDALLAEYLFWLMESYLKIFNHHYGELVLIVSDSDDINLLPPGFKPIAFNTDKRVFYSKHNKDKARILVEDCGIKIETAKIEATKILRFGANSIVFVLIQIIFQGAGFYLNFVDF